MRCPTHDCGRSDGASSSARDVNVVYEPARGQRIWAVRDVNLSLEQGEFVGLVGESGCGKSTLGYALTRMLRPPAHLDGGEIHFDGMDISRLSRRGTARAAPQRIRARAAERHERAQPGADRRAPLRRHPASPRPSDGEDLPRGGDPAPGCRVARTRCELEPCGARAATRTSCPAACASGCRSRSPCRSSRG